MRSFTAIQRFDHTVSTLCLSHRFSADTAKVARAVSHSGDGPLYLVIGFSAWWLQEAVGLWFLLTGLTAFAIELPIYWVLKRSFRRARPSKLPAFITPSDLYSMPSGHTAAAFLMAALLSTFFPFVNPFGVYLRQLDRYFSGVTGGAFCHRHCCWRWVRTHVRDVGT